MILVTGAYGFVGSALLAALTAGKISARGAVRVSREGDVNVVSVGEIGPDTDWSSALKDCNVVIHLAARVHVMSETENDAQKAYTRVNVDATMQLARQAHDAGVQRFVFVSSVKVNGEQTMSRPFTAFDVPAPCDPYGQSKMEAEYMLQQFGNACGMQVVIVRPPLVYGPAVKANFAALISLVDRGLPLPFGAVENRRSMIGLNNLSDLLITCCTHPRAAGQIFMASDGVDLGLPALIASIARSLGKRPPIFSVPVIVLRMFGKLTGRQDTLNRLLGSLQVDIQHTQSTLEWRPKITVESEIDRTVKHYLKIKNE